MPEDRYPKQLFSQKWNIKPRRGRQRKTLCRWWIIYFVALGIDKHECLQEVEEGDSLAASFIEKCINERDCK